MKLLKPSCESEIDETFDFRGISTDLMPTLLTMYDDLYAKLSAKDSPDLQQGTIVSESRSNGSFNHNVSNHSVSQMCEEPQESSRILGTSRPTSSISLSSSSSGNSLGNQASSYLASSESLDENEAIEEACRRRDRKGIKARREKLRAGSDDSGVQCHNISLPTPMTQKRRYCDPNLSYMDRVVLEIIETEEIYVQDLNQVIEGYLRYWQQNPEPAMASDTLGNLFSNMEEIYHFNKGFLSDLSQCGTDPVLVAKCFVRHNRGFTIYTDYCTNYPRTVSVLTSLMRDESTMHSCRKRQLSLGHTLPLGSYLLKPVQRVLKYHLLLGNIIKHFDKDQRGYNDIWDALSAMTGMAHHINDMKRRHEHSVRVQEIQSLLYGWTGEDLTTFGELSAEGAFRIHGFKGVRHVFLFDKMVLLAKKKDQNILVYKTHILCSNLMLIESIPGEPLNFHVIPFDNPRQQYTLECRSIEQKREWTQLLKRVILENYSAAIPAHARQLVMELGQAKPEVMETRSRRAHHAPEYLEKRKGKRRVSEINMTPKLDTTKNKKSNSRSSSCTRDSNRKISLSNQSNSSEKKQYKFPMWRRKSEPFVSSALSLPSSPIKSDDQEPSSNKQQSVDLIQNEPIESNNTDERDSTTIETKKDDGEDLHEIVTQLLQHRLEVQKMILNKQRRNVTRRIPCENDRPETSVSSVSPPPIPSLVSSVCTSTNSMNGNYDNLQDIWVKRETLYRNHSFKDQNERPSLPDRPCSVGDYNDNYDSGLSRDPTIASSESVTDTFNQLQDYLKGSNTSHGENKFPNPFKRSLSQPENCMTRNSYECLIDNIHPENKIYSSHRRSFRKVLNKLTSPKTPKQSTTDVSKKSSSLVSSVAKQYRKALKERVRQIRTDEDKPFTDPIGARLATENDYAVPQIDKTVRPNSVLSMEQNRPIYDTPEGLSRDPSPVVSEIGDCFYERTFEAIEMENDFFRDSAIYSDPEDIDIEYSNISLSPKNSFRGVNKHSPNSLRLEPRLKKTPPPVPCKPRSKGSLIEEKLKNLELNSSYCSNQKTITCPLVPIHERKRFLSVPNVKKTGINSHNLSSGWVRHVVGKLQDQDDISEFCMEGF